MDSDEDIHGKDTVIDDVIDTKTINSNPSSSLQIPSRPNSSVSAPPNIDPEVGTGISPPSRASSVPAAAAVASPVDADGREVLENDDDDEGSVGYEESAERDEIIRERINRTQEQMKFIVDNLSEEQLKRYERFRRVGFSRPTMEKLMQRILDQRVNTNSVIVATGIAKVFVGELIEGARIVMEEEIRAQLELSLLEPVELEDAIIAAMDRRPIEPFHILESHRRMRHENFTAPHSSLYNKPSPFQ